MSRIDLYWLPVGAGGRLVAVCSGAWERLAAWHAHRPRQMLFHAALIVESDGAEHVIEMAPVWSVPDAERGVVATGPVGSARLGHWAAFRYEVRCWRDGRLPDRASAIGSPVTLSTDARLAQRLLAAVPLVPRLTWGRDAAGCGDMWNSNSLVSWLLADTGLPTDLAPPSGGRAPGWSAGVALADRLAPKLPGQESNLRR